MANNPTSETTLIAVAKMYYWEKLSQQEIAERVHCSRTNVTRMLKQCVETGIVEFRIKSPSSAASVLHSQIQAVFHLDSLLIVSGDSMYEHAISKVGDAAAVKIDSMLSDGMLIGLPYGATVAQFVEHFRSSRVIRADVVQLMGGISPTDRQYDGQFLVNTLQNSFSGRPHLLQAPFIVQNAQTHDLLLKEPAIHSHFQLFKKLSLTVVGIGATNLESSAMYRAGHVSKKDMNTLIKNGAVADICGMQLDADGKLCGTSVTSRIIGITASDYLRTPIRIGCAAGKDKAVPILAALRGGYVNHLIIDENAASEVIALLSEEERQKMPLL